MEFSVRNNANSVKKGCFSMNKCCKRLTAAMLSVLLVAALFAGIVPAAMAEEIEYQYTDPYVIWNYPGTMEGYEEFRLRYAWYSPHEMAWTSFDIHEGTETSHTGNHVMMNLINRNQVLAGPAAGEEGTPYASIPAYCTDGNVYVQDNMSYRRINLEDCSYYDAVTAGRIRAIFLNSFPTVQDMTALEAAANAWLAVEEPESTPIVGLTGAEALLATQAAIWAQSNRGTFRIDDYYVSTEDNSGYEDWMRNRVLWPDTGSNAFESASEHTDNNIPALARYLCALAPVGPNALTVSDSTIHIQSAEAVVQEDGTYQVTVQFTTTATWNSGDELTVTVFCEDQNSSFALTGENMEKTHSVSFNNILKPDEVRVEINGYQTAADVFLFDGSGNRDASQSLVGYDDSTQPVHGEATTHISGDRILNIHKYSPSTPSGEASDGTGVEVGSIYTPLANVEFEIYHVADMDDLLSGSVVLSKTPTAQELAVYKVSSNYITTLITDGAGFASFNFSSAGYGDGVYLVVEKDNAAVALKAEPFYVSIPTTTPEGDGWLYTVHVYPKNDLVSGPEIDKDVTEVGKDEDTFHVGQQIRYIIRCDVPKDLYGVTADGTEVFAQNYTVTDTLDTRLDYLGAGEVQLITAAGETVALRDGEHYILTEIMAEGPQEGVEAKGAELSVSLTSAGMKYVQENRGSGDTEPEIRILFSAAINETALAGTEIPNNAVIRFTNSSGYEYAPAEVPEEDRPMVYMGGILISKYDSADSLQKLGGACFRLVRRATEEELADSAIEKVALTVGEETFRGVYVPFYPTADMTGEKVTETVTQTDGSAAMWGLAYGEYYLVETIAPEGYHLLSAPVTITIHESSHLEENTLQVANSSKFNLPAAGGTGTTVLTVMGLVFLAGAGAMLLTLRRRTA